MIERLWLITNNIHKDGKPLNINQVREEILAQGVDNLVFHMTWADYSHMSWQTQCGVNTEYFRTDHGYIHRSAGSDWALIPKEKIEEIIKEALCEITMI